MPNAGSWNGKMNILRGNGNARTKKGFVKNALRATWRMGRRGNAPYVPVFTACAWHARSRKNVICVSEISRKISSASHNGRGRGRGNASARHARNFNMDSGHAVCATPVVCTHTSQVGGKPGQADKTDARSVIYAYTYSVRANKQTPGCSDAAARSRRLRLQRSCERCVQKFRRRTQRSAGSPTSRQQQQKDQPQQKNPKKNASTDTRKRLDASKVQRRSGRSTSARTATRRRTAAFALARFRSQGIAASSFVFDMATSCVRSPMLAPAVARRSSQRKRREEYRANTRSLMEKHAQQLPYRSG